MPRKPQFLTVCLNPVMQRTMMFPVLRENEVNRTSRYYTHASGKGVNVTRVLTQLGAGAVHLTHAGGRDRDRFIEFMQRRTVLPYAGLTLDRRSVPVLPYSPRLPTPPRNWWKKPKSVLPGTEDAVRSLFAELIAEADAADYFREQSSRLLRRTSTAG